MKYINSYLPVVSNIYSSHEASWGPMIDVVVLPLFGTEKMLDNKDVGDLSSKCNSCLFFSQNFMTCVLLNLHLNVNKLEYIIPRNGSTLLQSTPMTDISVFPL